MLSLQLEGVYVLSSGTAAGPKETAGPLGSQFDVTYTDYYAGQKSFETGEVVMMGDACKTAIHKAKLKEGEVDLFIAGDLNNQIACSSKVAAIVNSSFLGVYGACSTSMLGAAVGSCFLHSRLIETALVSSTSSFGTAERQFRYPCEYGLPKRNTTTLTVTGSGALVLGRQPTKIKVSEVTFGQAYDVGWDDVNDMGSAMAYAAYETIKNHLHNLNHQASYYDLILTGDLSLIGSKILVDLFAEDGVNLKNHDDCGKIIYSFPEQKVFAGGSGAGCCPLVTYTEMFKRLLLGQYQRILVVATGALHDPTYVYQKKTIPAIAHAICFERN